ncbi:MAG: hypothetical protein H8Z69_03315 [Nanohaloarchaea archaeon]|nr:hypothetical protein [Candidatus Nanohaloarchaea archaeon]
MNRLIPITVIAISVAAGFLIATQPAMLEGAKIGEVKSDIKDAVEEPKHRHALFHIVVNGSELDLTAKRFQLNSQYVHLENNESNIVHTHADGVNWKNFLNTINTSIRKSNASEMCLDVYDRTWCGSGKIVLNGEEANLSNEIKQGDDFLIILDTENSTQITDEYMRKQLPRQYKPEEKTGRRV